MKNAVFGRLLELRGGLMTASVHTNFLTPGIRQVRKSIRDIDDSYNNEWDILAELCQNAVDAVRASKKAKGSIRIFVDAVTHTIEVADNGVGIEPDRLQVLLKPFSTDKDEDDSSIGEKGVGLTFAMFACNDFTIRTGASKAAEGKVRDAHNWKTRTDEGALDLEITPLESFEGTTVILKGLSPTLPIFSWTREQLVFILRTRTAVGSTEAIWNEPLDVEVRLSHRGPEDQQAHEMSIPFKFWLPTEGLPPGQSIDIDEFHAWTTQKDRSDQEKRRKLKDSVLTKTDIYSHSDGRTIKAYVCYVPSRRVWDALSLSAGLATDEQLENEAWRANFSYAVFSNGIFTAVKGMPTGVEISPPTGGYAGYWPNLFMLFEDQRLRFDIGRKSIHGRQSHIYRTKAAEYFADFLKVITRYVSGDVAVGRPSWNRDEAFKAIDLMPDLPVAGYSLKKSPKDQEAGVVALFFQAIAKGVITGITPLSTGYNNKYDLYALLGNRRVVVEFKSRASNILKDLNDERKMFDEIDAIVAWDVSEDDVENFRRKDIQLEAIRPGLLQDEPGFPYATHEMHIANVNPIYVIDLKQVLLNAENR